MNIVATVRSLLMFVKVRNTGNYYINYKQYPGKRAVEYNCKTYCSLHLGETERIRLLT